MITQRAPEIDLVTARLAAARRLVGDLQPFSPAWDAAMAWLDELEGEAGEHRRSISKSEQIGLAVTA